MDAGCPVTGRARQRAVEEGRDRVEAIICRAMVEVDAVCDEVEALTGVRIIPPSPMSPNYRPDEPEQKPVLRVVTGGE
jgi:hypothetical protein